MELLPLLLDPFFWFALAVAVWGVTKLAGWMASGGRLPMRGQRGSASAFGPAGLTAQAFYGPDARQALEARVSEEMRREEDDEGDPPEAGGDGRSSAEHAGTGRGKTTR
jgi:hypothetical protein